MEEAFLLRDLFELIFLEAWAERNVGKLHLWQGQDVDRGGSLLGEVLIDAITDEEDDEAA